jgi:hypothetical protein
MDISPEARGKSIPIMRKTRPASKNTFCQFEDMLTILLTDNDKIKPDAQATRWFLLNKPKTKKKKSTRIGSFTDIPSYVKDMIFYCKKE